jgi:hypothetical protein
LNAALLQTQLQLPYRRASWFSTTGLLPQLLPGRLELFTQPVEFTLATEAEQAVATGFRQLGRIFLPPAAPGGPERIVALHEITVAANIDLLRNRVGLRRLVARGIDEVNAHAVLAFFVQPGETAYRLTYAARESVMNTATLAIERQETAARRFTYILGPGDARRTAALRLAGLANERTRATASLESLTAAFAVESLNNEFFTLYRAHYEAFRDYLLGTDAPTRLFAIPAAALAAGVDAKLRDRALKPVRDFVKKLLGRIVFLHFLQKKGWLGCPATSRDWTHGDPLFLDHLFRQTPTADRFHSERLVPLFYDTLNRPDRPGDLFPVTGSRVPYLNGGLFERDFPGVDRVDFPGELFARLFEFLGGYHFTIDENDPEDHEIGIDPEMLGHIFENLLEDNKDKGAYYTPKAVVHYMARQSLVHALTARFPGDVAAPVEIATFLRLKEPIDPRTTNWLSTHATDLAAHLDDLRICDPAIGSGAFPIGLLHEIYWAKLALNPALPRAAAKRAIIQNSIHGVDLDAGAVEIARLRFWLALVVDETAPSPLPNLDYQIMQGNSLLESFEGEPLDDLAEPTRYGIRRLGEEQHEFDLGAAQTEIVEVATPPQQRLAELRTAYFRCHDPLEKGRLRGEIDAAVLQAIDARLDRRRDELETSLQQEATFVGRRARTAKETKARAAMKDELAALRGKTARLHALLADPRAERPFFLWHLWFRHVLADAPEGRGGFDIVIANPPYGRIMTREDEAALAVRYPMLASTGDAYVAFIQLAWDLLRARGNLTYIVPTSWLGGPAYEAFRADLLNKMISEVVVLPFDIFKEAYVDTLILTASLEAPQEQHRFGGFVYDKRAKPDELEPTPLQRIAQSDIQRLRGRKMVLSEAGLQVALRIQSNCSKIFGDVLEIKRGVLFDRQLLTPEKRGQNSYAYFEGDVYRYELNYNAPRWVEFGPEMTERPSEAKWFTDERILLRRLVNRRQRLMATHAIEPFITNKNLYSGLLKSPEFSLKLILGLLNSALVSRLYIESVSQASKDDFPQVTITDVSALPFPSSISPAQQAELTAKVDAILAAKRAGDAARVTTLEAEIDAIVYRLYGLAAPEIALIEGRA